MDKQTAISSSLRTLVLAGAALCLLVWLIFKYYGFYPEQIELGPSAKARYTPFLAAGQYLQKSNKQVSHQNNLQLLDKPVTEVDLMVISTQPGHLTEQRFHNLESWLDDGGHLIYSTNHQGSHELDLLLNKLNAELFEDTSEVDVKKTEKALELGESMFPELGNLKLYERPITRLEFNNPDTNINVAFDPRWSIYDYSESAKFFSDQDDDRILQYTVGKGRITLLSDIQFWFNPNIDQHDHAYFLQVLTGNAEQVLFLFGGEHLSIFSRMKNMALPAFLALFTLILLIIWKSMLRLGPIKKINIVKRRNISEHIIASAQLRWNQSQQKHWLEAIKAQLERQAGSRNPSFNHLSTSLKIEWLSSISKLPESKIAEIYHTETDQLDEDSFLSIMISVQKLRNIL